MAEDEKSKMEVDTTSAVIGDEKSQDEEKEVAESDDKITIKSVSSLKEAIDGNVIENRVDAIQISTGIVNSEQMSTSKRCELLNESSQPNQLSGNHGQMKSGTKRQAKYKVRTIPFLRQLKKMIEEVPNVIQWDNGNIIIPDPKQLEKTLPLYYKHNNYASFQRQLNNFGYHRKFAHFVVNNNGQLDTVYHKLGTPMSANIEDLLTLRPVLERTSDKKRDEEFRQKRKLTAHQQSPSATTDIQSPNTSENGVPMADTSQDTLARQTKNEQVDSIPTKSAPTYIPAPAPSSEGLRVVQQAGYISTAYAVLAPVKKQVSDRQQVQSFNNQSFHPTNYSPQMQPRPPTFIQSGGPAYKLSPASSETTATQAPPKLASRQISDQTWSSAGKEIATSQPIRTSPPIQKNDHMPVTRRSGKPSSKRAADDTTVDEEHKSTTKKTRARKRTTPTIKGRSDVVDAVGALLALGT